jgi:hypothetical protein
MGMRPEDLPELGVVKTASPCKASWEAMEGDDARRFCAQCSKYVYDFSQLTSTEARELLLSTEGRLCARIFTRADGTVLTKDCPVGVTRARRKKVGAVAAAVALVGGAVTTTAALSVTMGQIAPPIGSVNHRENRVMGEVAIERPPPAPVAITSGNPPDVELMGDVLVAPAPPPVRSATGGGQIMGGVKSVPPKR